MLRNDYIIRQILELVKVAARIIRKIVTGRTKEAEQDVRGELVARTGLDLETLGSLSYDSMVRIVGGLGAGAFDPVRLITTAEMLGLEAEICEASGESDMAMDWRLRALTLYLAGHELLLHESLGPARLRLETLLEQVLDRVDESDLPAPTRIGLFAYMASTGRLAKAEDLLFQLLQDEVGGLDLLASAISIYRSWLELPDHLLESGGLPRDEVQEGLEELEQLLRVGKPHCSDTTSSAISS